DEDACLEMLMQMRATPTAVIPGRAKGANPESILRSSGYGFRIRSLSLAPRNDSGVLRCSSAQPLHRPSPQLLIVEMHRVHRPQRGVVALRIIPRGLRRIPVHQRSQEHRMREASHLVLDGEE